MINRARRNRIIHGDDASFFGRYFHPKLNKFTGPGLRAFSYAVGAYGSFITFNKRTVRLVRVAEHTIGFSGFAVLRAGTKQRNRRYSSTTGEVI